MPVLTIRMSDTELKTVKRAARSHGRATSEFSRNAILTAAQPAEDKSKDYPLGAWRGRVSYKKAIKFLRG